MEVRRNITVSTSDLNRNGYRVLSKGVDLSYYKLNPVVFYNHKLSTAIGVAVNPRFEDGIIKIDGIRFTDFEPTHPLAHVAKQFKEGTLRAVSLGHIPTEISKKKKHLVEGQKLATVVKTEVIEISVATVQANRLAVYRITENGKYESVSDTILKDMLSLNESEKETSLPPAENPMELNEPTKIMDSDVLQALGLPKTASKDDALKIIKKLFQPPKGTVTETTTKTETITDTNIGKDFVLYAGEMLGVITTKTDKEYFGKLAEKDSVFALETMQKFAEKLGTKTEIDTTPKQPSQQQVIDIAEILSGANKGTEAVKKDWDWYAKNNEKGLEEMWLNNRKKYNELYKERFGSIPE